jgi:hypothetical protein
LLPAGHASGKAAAPAPLGDEIPSSAIILVFYSKIYFIFSILNVYSEPDFGSCKSWPAGAVPRFPAAARRRRDLPYCCRSVDFVSDGT